MYKVYLFECDEKNIFMMNSNFAKSLNYRFYGIQSFTPSLRAAKANKFMILQHGETNVRKMS